MRYFKFEETNTTEMETCRAEYAKLIKNKTKLVRKEKIKNTLATILFFLTIVLVICAFVLGSTLLSALIPVPTNIMLSILYYIGLVLGIMVSFLSGTLLGLLVGSLISSPFWGKKYEEKKNDLFSKACLHLRNHYELQPPYLVTKCHHSSDKRFINHDVSIFVVGDELRITTNLIHGFLHGYKDLGCYSFKAQEISVSKKQNGELLIAELKADATEFLLGYRAKGFIEKNFITKS